MVGFKGVKELAENLMRAMEITKNQRVKKFGQFEVELPKKTEIKFESSQKNAKKILKGFQEGTIPYFKKKKGGVLVGLSLLSRNGRLKAGMELLTGLTTNNGYNTEEKQKIAKKSRALLATFIQGIRGDLQGEKGSLTPSPRKKH